MTSETSSVHLVDTTVCTVHSYIGWDRQCFSLLLPPKVVHVCVGSTRLVHTLSWPRKIRQSKVPLRGQSLDKTRVDCVFLSSTAFASLSSCGVVGGMKFVLALSHPPSSSLSPSSLTPQKRTLEQGTTLLIFVHCGVLVQVPMLMLRLRV